MLSIQKLAALCLLSSLILLVSADEYLNPCNNTDWESADSDFLKNRCEQHIRSKYDIDYGCIEQCGDKYVVICKRIDGVEFSFLWLGPDPVYRDRPSNIVGDDIPSDYEGDD